MWQRFSEGARRVVFYSQEEAQKYGEGYVSTEHLLLGLCRDEDTTAAKTVEALGLTLYRLDKEIRKQLPGLNPVPSQDMTLTARAKRVIDLAYDEARYLNDGFIGTEHILLGLIREGDGMAARVLNKLGIELLKARKIVCVVREAEGNPCGSKDPSPSDDSLRPERPVRNIEDRVAERLSQYREQVYGAELLGLVVLADEGTGDLLRSVEIDPEELSTLLEFSYLQKAEQMGRDDLSSLQPNPVADILKVAQEEAKLSGQPVDSRHVLVAMLAHGENFVAAYLLEEGQPVERLRDALSRSEG